MRDAFIILGAAALAGCLSETAAPPLAPPPPVEADRPAVHLFRGQPEHLDALVSAGRDCGYTADELTVALETPHLLLPYAILVTARGARLDCLRAWIGAHPETGFEL